MADTEGQAARIRAAREAIGRRFGNLPLDEVEKRSILEALKTCGGNKSEAARRLGITRKTLRKKLEKYESQ